MPGSLETAFFQARADVQPRPLGKGACVAVIIQNRLNNIDGTGNNTELMVGWGTGQIYQMLPGQESPIIYVRDLEDIYVRTRSTLNDADPAVLVDAEPVDFVVFMFRERPEQ